MGSGTSEERSDCHLVVERLKKILRVLPPREEMRRRAEGFWRTSGWYNTILRRDEFEAVYEPAVYAPSAANPLSPHKLACVLIVLTLEAYFDLSSDEEHPAIGEYWEGVQKCFDTRFGWAASVAGVQALVCFLFYKSIFCLIGRRPLCAYSSALDTMEPGRRAFTGFAK